MCLFLSFVFLLHSFPPNSPAPYLSLDLNNLVTIVHTLADTDIKGDSPSNNTTAIKKKTSDMIVWEREMEVSHSSTCQSRVYDPSGTRQAIHINGLHPLVLLNDSWPPGVWHSLSLHVPPCPIPGTYSEQHPLHHDTSAVNTSWENTTAFTSIPWAQNINHELLSTNHSSYSSINISVEQWLNNINDNLLSLFYKLCESLRHYKSFSASHQTKIIHTKDQEDETPYFLSCQ